jgi:hypothetical protein
MFALRRIDPSRFNGYGEHTWRSRQEKSLLRILLTSHFQGPEACAPGHKEVEMKKLSPSFLFAVSLLTLYVTVSVAIILVTGI